jgi:hypothetical protein
MQKLINLILKTYRISLPYGKELLNGTYRGK